MATYASVSDVQARVPGRAISATSSPTTTQVETWIDEAEAAIDSALLAAELPAPYTSTAAVRIIRSWVVDYPEARARMAHAAKGGDGQNDDGKDVLERFEARIRDIISNPAMYGALLAGGDAPSSSVKIRAYTTDNADSLSVSNGDFAPTFTRDEVF